MSDVKWTAGDIVQMLRSKYSGQDWAFVPQVPNGTGMAKSRTCDGMAMSLWPSKGLHLHGFEIKVSRADWLTELQDVSKAAAFSRYCHYWWIVAPPKVVAIGEMPADWGLLMPTSNGNLRTKKAATLTNPENPDHALLAGLFRACLRESPSRQALDAARQQGDRAAWERAQKDNKHHESTELRMARQELEHFKQSVRQFQEASGIEIGRYNGHQLGELVAAIKGLRPDDLKRDLERMSKTLAHSSQLAVDAARSLEIGNSLAESQDKGS